MKRFVKPNPCFDMMAFAKDNVTGMETEIGLRSFNG
jgi:hypothetical protein